mmetsp:Transcript_111408/g.239997  ORF Transcript_111408/g.239997 Transcript_111408/m.239997 type:complete len:292 (+) Transcript_111408:325-1200(+)
MASWEPQGRAPHAKPTGHCSGGGRSPAEPLPASQRGKADFILGVSWRLFSSVARASLRWVASFAARDSASLLQPSALRKSSLRLFLKAWMYGFSVMDSLWKHCPSPSSAGRAEVWGPLSSAKAGMAPNFCCICPARSRKFVALKKSSRAPSACLLSSGSSASRRSTLKSIGKPSSCAAMKWSRNSSKTATRWLLISTIWSPTAQPNASASALQKPTTEVPWRRRPRVPSSSSLSTCTWRRRKHSAAIDRPVAEPGVGGTPPPAVGDSPGTGGAPAASGNRPSSCLPASWPR